MLRDLTVRSLDGTKIFGDFTPPAGSAPAVELCLLGLAHACFKAHQTEGVSLWSAYQPVSRHNPNPEPCLV